MMPEEEQQDGYVFDQTVSEQREDWLTDQLVAFNLAHSTALPGEHVEAAPLHVYALDRAGAVLGGIVGRTHAIPAWFEISVIWVDERLRHQGLGRRLIEQAEQEASRRGCRYVRLATSNFQAPAFYQKLGYTLYGTLENCPPGETVFYFWKQLGPAVPD
ncbi:MAG TPA: GNAT family N-acetyltransferase [Ktedonobacterales bacterium]